MELKKNEEYIVRIIDNGYEGEGIGQKLKTKQFLSQMELKGKK